MPETLDRVEFEARHQKVVRDEIEAFRVKAEAFLAGQIPEDDFKPFRLRHGVYGQRQPGVQMVRVKIPSGLLTARQMEQLGNIADEFGGGRGHFTTRQNIQYHFVPLARVAPMMHRMADVGLTNREACYNTVRNITTCPMAGLSRNEVFDVRPYAQKLAYALLRKELTQNLPRKFKIAFDGCGGECVAGGINDIGLQARVRDGRRGFRMAIGGGLGPLPVEAKLLEEFLPEEQLLPKVEAVIRVFNQYGNRKNRNMARMKFVIRDRGWEWMKEAVEAAWAEIQLDGGLAWPESVPEGFGGFQASTAEPVPLSLPPVIGNGSGAFEAWLESNTIEQKQPGLYAVVVRIEQGNLTGDQMRRLACLSAAGDGLFRVGLDQNLVMGSIPRDRLRGVYAVLEQLSLAGAGAREISDVVTCPGAYSCNLALTKSMSMGPAMREAVESYGDPVVRRMSIKVSGCPNSCAQHWIADFGFYGNARKIDGREVPHYQMVLGGGYDAAGVLRFGMAVQSIPARLAPGAVRRVLDHFVANRVDGETFREYVLRHKVEFFRQFLADIAKPANPGPELFQDWGDDTPFTLQLGRGECAAV
ncbi:MAG TPA: nitrite/sulfite reductase [Bryobacteraceae bacterium]|nr:nitrite/sulfite reductase [Bryobacteraceae bacterium]